MRPAISLILLAGLALPATPAFAGEEPCKIVLCMFGELMGESGGGECKSSVKEYFSVIKTKKKGKFDPSGTARARMKFLDRCSDNTTGEKKKINDKFGMKQGL